MRRDSQVTIIYFGANGLQIVLTTNRSFVLTKREEIAQIVDKLKSCKKIENAIYHCFSKNSRNKIKVRVEQCDKKKKKWKVLIKYRNTSNSLEEP